MSDPLANSPFRRHLRIDSAADAAQLLGHLADVMDALLGVVEEETALVRAGRMADAAELEQTKGELSRLYLADSERLKANAAFLSETVPESFEALRRRHDTFRAVLQINLTVLATAHAVSEGIIRGVAGELARKAAPQTYGLSGRPNSPGPSVAQPVAVSRRL